MIITIDTEKAHLCADSKEYPLFSAEAFQILSRQWMRLGWNLNHWSTFSWKGRQFLQYPDDVLRLGELLWRLKPDVMVETGVYDGGSTLFFANFCRHVISIEKEFRPGVRQAIFQGAENLVTLIEGDSASAEAAAAAAFHIREGERVCGFLDSDHSAKHVRAELESLGPLVSDGCYLIVADSNMAELAGMPEGETGWVHDNPGTAVEEFLADHAEFRRDRPVALFPVQFDFSELSYFPTTWLKRCR